MAGFLGNQLRVETHDGTEYRGFLGAVDPVTQTITLITTTGRSRHQQDILIFRGQDIKRLSEVAKTAPDDPAILSRGPVISTSHPSPRL